MKARTRSISGALMMLVIIPIFAGLLACMPEYVPLDNPEQSRDDRRVKEEHEGIISERIQGEMIGGI
jgi:hypothetical protein